MDNKKYIKSLIIKFFEFKEKYDNVDNNTSNKDTRSDGSYYNKLDTTTHNNYKIYPNIYVWFSRNERRILKKYGYNLNPYL